MSETVITEQHDSVLLITMNRPDSLNAMNSIMHAELQQLALDVAEDESVRAVVVTGAGRGFSAGEDLHELAERNRRLALQESAGVVGLPRSVAVTPMYFRRLEIPVVAAINGPCAGAGFGMAYMSDIRIASERARFVEVYARRGFPPSSGPWFLSRLVGPTVAQRMVLLGEELSAAEALETGLVHEVVPHDDLLDTALGYAQKLASLPPTTVRYSKFLLQKALDLPLEQYLELGSFVRGLARVATKEATVDL